MLTPDEQVVVLLSLKVALVAVAASLPFAVGAGWLLARRRFPGRLALDALIHLPLVLPPVVCLLYTSPSPRDRQKSRMPSSA